MSITLNIDDATVAQLEQAAKASRVSSSQLVARLVQQNRVTATPPGLKKPTVLPPLPPPHDFGSPPDFDYRKAQAMLDDEDAVAYREKLLKGK